MNREFFIWKQGGARFDQGGASAPPLNEPLTLIPVSSGGEGVYLWLSDEQQSLPAHRVFQQHSGTLGHQEQEHHQDSGGRTRV